MVRGGSASRVEQLRREFSRVLSEAYLGHGYKWIASTSGVPEATVRRYLHDQAPTDGRESASVSVGALARNAPVEKSGEELRRIYGELVRAARVDRGDDRRPDAVPAETWYGVIPPDGKTGRSYLSVDEVQLDLRGADVTGTMTRRFPSTGRRPHVWALHGVADGSEAVFLTYRAKQQGVRSHGTISLLRKPGQQPVYSGTYARRGDGERGELIQRPYFWYQELPSEQRPAVALLGLGHTLMRADPLQDFLDFLCGRGFAGAAAARSAIRTATPPRSAKRADHFAARPKVISAYQQLVDNEPTEFKRAIRNWAERNLTALFYPWARPLVDAMHARGLAPILVTAAPKPIADAAARRLGVDEVFSLDTDRPDDDPGAVLGRERITDRLRDQGRDFAMSVTSVPQDRLADARVNVVVGRERGTRGAIDAFLPPDSEPAAAVALLDRTRDAPLFPPLSRPHFPA